MNTKSVKAKGRVLQNFVRDELRQSFIYLSDLKGEDIKSQTMGMTGEDIVLSPAAKRLVNFSFECKNVEKLSIWKAIEQCESNTTDKRHPTVVFKKNGKHPHVVISWETFLDMLKTYIYVEIPDEDLYEDGELNKAQVKHKMAYRVLDEGDWLLMRRRDK